MEDRSMVKVLNARRAGIHSTESQVYIGRPSKWGNPFVIGRDGSRTEAIKQYQHWIARQPALMAELGELRGKNLVCWCAPLACHGDVLLELAGRYVCDEV
jgi:hypothetical protein